MDDDKKQEKLERLLIELSSQQEALQTDGECYVEQIATIYADGYFRHMYSGFYATLTFIDSDDRYDLEILNQNIKMLYDMIHQYYNDGKENVNQNVYRGMTKFYDHVNLDIARINYLRGISETAEKLKAQVEKTGKESKMLMSKASKMQREYITILGIFAAILVAFFGGLSFSNATLSSIDKATIYRLLLTIILLGTVLFNILALLMNFIRDMVAVSQNHRYCWIIVANIAFIILLAIIGCWWHWQYLGYGTL